jgi:hypothetical protein
VQQLFPIRPVETDPAGLGGKAQRLEQCRQAARNAGKHRSFTSLQPLTRLDLLPLRQDLFGGIESIVAEHVRVTLFELVADPPGDRFEVEFSALFGNLCLKHDLQQQIPQFLTQGIR